MRYAVSFILLFSSGVSLAQSSVDAERMFREARALIAEGKFPLARPLLEESYRLEPALGTLLNLADCLEKTGELPRALRTFVEVEIEAKKKGDRRREDIARTRRNVLHETLGFLRIANTRGERIELTRFPGGTREPAVEVEPGLVALVPGRYSVRVGGVEQEVTLARPGEVLVLETARAPIEAAPVVSEIPVAVPPAVQSEVSERWRLRPWGVAGMIAGAIVSAGGLSGAIYSLDVYTRVGRQQAGGPDEANPTVTRREYEGAQVVLPVCLSSIAVGVAALMISWILGRETIVATVAPTSGGLVAALGVTW